ncbi:hypothetical protein Emed_006776 [Eimeria media]
MENLGGGQQPLLEQEEAGELLEGPSIASHHADTADPEHFYIKESTRATRYVTNRRVLLGALATVVLALVLLLRKRLLSVAKPSPVQAPEETGKKLPVGEEKPEELPLGETPGGPEIKPQTGEGEPEFKQVLNKIVDWARQQHTEKPLSMREALDISCRECLKRNSVEYLISANFRTLTPAYNPEKTADELKEELSKFFEEIIASEEEIRSTQGISIVSNGFGDQENGRIDVMVRGESLFALSWLDFPLGASLPK